MNDRLNINVIDNLEDASMHRGTSIVSHLHGAESFDFDAHEVSPSIGTDCSRKVRFLWLCPPYKVVSDKSSRCEASTEMDGAAFVSQVSGSLPLVIAI